jgi:hypothetical protein
MTTIGRSDRSALCNAKSRRSGDFTVWNYIAGLNSSQFLPIHFFYPDTTAEFLECEIRCGRRYWSPKLLFGGCSINGRCMSQTRSAIKVRLDVQIVESWKQGADVNLEDLDHREYPPRR